MKTFIWDALAHHFDCPFAGDPRGLDRALAIRDAISYPTEKPAAMVSILLDNHPSPRSVGVTANLSNAQGAEAMIDTIIAIALLASVIAMILGMGGGLLGVGLLLAALVIMVGLAGGI